MFKRININILLLIFIVLAALVVFITVYDSKKGERTFKSELFTVDSSKIDKITIFPKGKNKSEIKLTRTGKNWEVMDNNKSYPADTMAIKDILRTLTHVKVESVAGTEKSTWKNFELADTSSTEVIVGQGKETIADFRYGKISYSQNRQAQYYGGNRNISVKSHIRIAGDNNVYVVDGFFPVIFSEQVSQFRIKTVFRFDKSLLTKLTFIYPSDSSFTLAKDGNKWSADEKPVDSTAVENYLNSLANTTNSDFADDQNHFPPVSHRLIINGNSMNPLEIKGSIDSLSKKFYISSSFNSSVTFGSADSYLFNHIFVSRNKFIIKKENKSKEKISKKKK